MRISLDQYSTFQYMLAPPWTAKPILDQISSVVFLGEPKRPGKAEDEHVVFARGDASLWTYYFVCLWVLPSHALRASRWIVGREEVRGRDANEGDVLRHFRYEYYWGFLRVDTYHVRDKTVAAAAAADDDRFPFRLVEYFDTKRWVVNSIAGGFYAACFAVLAKCGRDTIFASNGR